MNRLLLYILVAVTLVFPLKWAVAAGESGSADYSPLSFAVNYVYRRAGVGELKTIENGDALQSGDHYKIVFTPDKDCYVYIFQIDSSGQIFQLFPMKSFHGVEVNNFNPVKQGKTHILPSPDKAFILDKVVGVERIYFIAANDRDEQLEGLCADLKRVVRGKKSGEARDTHSKLNRYFRRRGIEVVPSGQNIEVPWKETGDVFSIMGRRLENLSSDSIHILEFIHK